MHRTYDVYHYLNIVDYCGDDQAWCKTRILRCIGYRGGYTPLHIAVAENSECLKMILALYPEEQRPEAIKERTDTGNTLLHEAAAQTRATGSVERID